MTTYAMPDDVSFAGEWWLPAEPSRKIPGTLAWSKNRATLELHDGFIPLRSGSLLQSSQSQPVVHGATTDSKLITVIDASWTRGNTSFGQGGIRRPESFISSLVIIGAHVGSETRFLRLRARIPGLPAWLGESGIQQTITRPTPEHPDPVINYRISRNTGEQVELPSVEAMLRWGTGWSTAGSVLTAVTISSYGYLEITPHEPQTLDWYFEQLGKATTLLAFMAGSPMKADEITAKIVEAQTEINVLVDWNNPGYCSYSNPNEFFMPCRTMGAPLDAVFRKWFDLYASVATPSQLALSVLSSEGLWVHVQFLLLVQALEGFHRAAADHTQLPLVDPFPVNRSDATTCDQGSPLGRAQIARRAKRGHKATLGNRLADLANRLDPSLRRLILGGDGSVSSAWVDTRNYYTHWIPQLRRKALDTIGMYYANVRLRHFLRALYLDYVGIPQTSLAKALNSTNNESQHLLQLNHPAATFGHVDVRPATTAESGAEEPHAGD